MKKYLKQIFTCVLTVIITTVFIGYHSDVAKAAPDPQLNKTVAEVVIGNSLDLKVLNQIQDAKCSWSTTNIDIATVSDNGIVKAIADGTVTIRCQVNASNQTYDLSCEVTVVNSKVIPSNYKQADQYKGKVVKLNYTTHSYTNKKKKLHKYVNVYLPKGYNSKDKKKRYNILYLMHGGGENVNTILNPTGTGNSMLMRIIDNMIYNKDIDPLIIVTPTFYNEVDNDAFALTKNFYIELTKDIIPAVESKYHSYANTTSKKNLIATREHRAFAGFSMGSACTWFTFINSLDYFKYYLPFSGDCWELGQGAGGSRPQETAELLAKVVKKSGYGLNDFNIYCATGSNDIAYDNLNSQMNEMKKVTDSFVYSDDFTKGNLHFMVKHNGSHMWNDIYQYIFNLIPYVFKY